MAKDIEKPKEVEKSNDVWHKLTLNMSVNDNGLYTASWTTLQNHHQISEGAIVGISFAWIIGAIGFYILGVFIICKCIPKRIDNDTDSEED